MHNQALVLPPDEIVMAWQAIGVAARGMLPVSTQGANRRRRLAYWCHRAGLLPVAGRLRGLLRSDLRILAYHRVLESVQPEGFDFDLELISADRSGFHAQMSLLKRSFSPMSFQDVIDCLDQDERLPPRAVLVTFDDGYDDNYRVAYPVLRDLGMSAMFFVSTAHIDSGAPYAYDWAVHMICRTRHDHLKLPQMGIDWALPPQREERRRIAARFLARLKTFPAAVQQAQITELESAWSMPRRPHADCRPMDWEQLREMQAGGMEIGSHGVSHSMLARMRREEMLHEVNESRRVLEAQLARPVQVMSYPVGDYGAYDEAVMQATREAGFRLACSYVAGTSRSAADDGYALRRLHVERDVDLPFFRGMLELPELFSYATDGGIA